MNGRRLWLVVQRQEALLSMLLDDGAAPPNQVNTDHLDALLSTDVGEPASVAEAHKNGQAPPEVGRP